MLARRGFLKMLGGLLMAGFGTGAYAVGIEPLSQPRVTRYEVNPTGWPRGLKLRIVALADFHACEPWMPARRIAAICDQANALGGDMIVLHTDGVTEAENSAGELFGIERLCDSARQFYGSSAEDAKSGIIEALMAHIGKQKIHDDITLVVMRHR